ncbi:MAG: TAXI family TRAP transporter solute-binding subunit [Chloroflexi bacterium]|nr:TAXI family TRAP transporter solute-binding subunit [Chloroflexota bacterium]
MKRLFSLAAVGLAAAVILVGCAPAARPAPGPATAPATKQIKWPPTMTMNTPGTAGPGYTVGAALAATVSNHLPTKFITTPFTESLAWIKMMKTSPKEVDFGIHQTAELPPAYRGILHFSDVGPVPIKQVAVGSIVNFGIVTTDPSVKTVADLKGKTWFGFTTGYAIESMSNALMKIYALEGKTNRLQGRTPGLDAEGVIQGKAVAIFSALGPWVQDIAQSKKVYFVPITPEDVKDMAREVPGVLPHFLKAGQLGATQDVPTVGLPIVLAARADLDEELVYTVIKTMYASYDEYKGVHPFLRDFTPENGVKAFGAPAHPGAIKYFKEKGLWTQAVEEAHQPHLKAYTEARK